MLVRRIALLGYLMSGTYAVAEPPTLKPTHTFSNPTRIERFKFLPAGRFLYWSAQYQQIGTLKIGEMAHLIFDQGQVRYPQNMPNFVINYFSGTVSDDGTYLAISGHTLNENGNYADNRLNVISVWNLKTGEQTRFRPAPGGDASFLVMGEMRITPDNKILLSTDNLGYLHAYDLPRSIQEKKAVELFNSDKHATRTNIELSLSTDGAYAYTRTVGSKVTKFRLRDGAEVETISIPHHSYGFEPHPDGVHALVTRGRYNLLINTATGAVLKRYGRHTYQAFSGKISPDGKSVLSLGAERECVNNLPVKGGCDIKLQLWDLQTATEKFQLGEGTIADDGDPDYSFSADSRKIVAAGRSLYTWDLGVER